MKRSGKGGQAARRQKRPIVLVFGEEDTDRQAIAHLTRALNPRLDVQPRRRPLVLMKGASQQTRRDNAEEIARLAAAEHRVRGVVAVLAHQDCDALEPAHEAVGETIEQSLRNAGCPGTPIGVTPAWEIEAWWMVFPEAVSKVVPSWRTPSDWVGRDVGQVRNAKEALTRALRGDSRLKRDYSERDSPEVARHIVELGLLGEFSAGARRHGGVLTRSGSFERFRSSVLQL